MPRIATAAAATTARGTGAADAGAADAGAASSDAARSDKRRQWRNRRPAARRVELTPEEAERLEAERRAKLRIALLSVKFTADEKAELRRRAKASGNRVSDFVRLVLLDPLKAPAPAARDPAAIRTLAFQLSKIGTNQNQLAHIANESRALPQEAELRRVSALIVAALEKVMAL
jgi:Bacterial mobilisation protein (MobC)